LQLVTIKHLANSEKDKYSVVLKGRSSEILESCLVDVELKISGKYQELIDLFDLDVPVFFKMEPVKSE